MAVDKLVDSTELDNDLTSVANAIRTKGGTEAPLTFPDGFVAAVQNIPSGTALPGKTVTISGACEIDVSDVGDYGYFVRIDGFSVSENTGRPCFGVWNLNSSIARLYYPMKDANPSNGTYASYWSFNSETREFTYSGVTQTSYNMRGTWQFIPVTYGGS